MNDDRKIGFGWDRVQELDSWGFERLGWVGRVLDGSMMCLRGFSWVQPKRALDLTKDGTDSDFWGLWDSIGFFSLGNLN